MCCANRSAACDISPLARCTSISDGGNGGRASSRPSVRIPGRSVLLPRTATARSARTAACTAARLGLQYAPQLQWLKGERRVFESSPGVGRGFCDQCGTPLTWEGESLRYAGKKIAEVHVSTLDTPELFIPNRHWFDAEGLPWFNVADSLPRYCELDYSGVEPTHRGPESGVR